MQFSKSHKLIKVKAGAASAGTALVSDVVDTAGFEGVCFFGSIATANAGNYASVQQGLVADGSASADLAGTKVVPTADADTFMIDIAHPRERYVKCTVVRAGADTVTGDVYAVLYGARKEPVTQGATIDMEAHVAPAEGTA